MTILIEKNVAIPGLTGKKMSSKYPLAKMKVSDSFAVKPKSVKNFQNNIANQAKRLGNIKIATRSYPDGTVRVWRTA